MKISELPAVKFLIIASIGYLIGNFFQFSELTLFLFLIIAVLLFCSFLLLKRKQLAYFFSVILFGVYFSGNVSNTTINTPDRIIPEFPAQFKGKIMKILSQKDNYIKCLAEGTLSSKIFSSLENSRIILNIFFPKNKEKFVSISNRIIARVKARVPQKPVFPYDFDENRYAKSIDIQWICRANAKDVAIRSRDEDIISFKENSVDFIKKRLNYLFPENTVGIATALLTGDKTQIPTDVKNNFSYTGTSHILAISGFHIGLIASIIFIILGFIKNNIQKLLLFSPLLIIFIIFTGLQPSSIRAGIFIFLLLITKQVERKIYPLNILALTVILILLFSPQMVNSIGFQMSVLAVAGIMLLYQPIIDFFELFVKKTSKITDYAIKTFSISIAAGITVSPIVAYYFGIFSIIQPLSNFFVVPAISLGMMFALLSLIISFISFPLATFYSNSADFLFSLTQKFNEYAVEFNFSYIQGNNVFAISLAISLILIYIILSKKKQQVFFRISFSFCAFILFIFIISKQHANVPDIYPCENYVVSHIPLSTNKDCILIVDRKPRLYPSKEYNVLNFIKSKRGEILLAYTGNIGINYCDYYKNIKRIKRLPLSLEMQRKIAKNIFNKNYLHKETFLNYD